MTTSDIDENLINDLKKDEELEGDSDTEAVPDTIFNDASIHINAENAFVEKTNCSLVTPGGFYVFGILNLLANLMLLSQTILSCEEDVIGLLRSCDSSVAGEVLLLWGRNEFRKKMKDLVRFLMCMELMRLTCSFLHVGLRRSALERILERAACGGATCYDKLMMMKHLKEKIRLWNKGNTMSSINRKRTLKSDLVDLDLIIDKGCDDVIFMGQWNESNLDTIVQVLECFHRASGLRLNMSKSKLIRIYVDADKVAQAARKIGCVTLKTSFTYLGSKLGGHMSRIQSWNETIEAMTSRLSKWKMKTLSIGGRLTLLKSVLGSMPIYHMSILKVPMKILQRMESIRSHFFNGSDHLAKKLTWVKWANVLASKEKGGLGISSLYALNRALMFKWVWRFLSQNSSLWANVIKSIHGDHGKIVTQVKSLILSIWLDIVKELAFTFRREPRGRVEQDQFDSLKAMVEGTSLVNIRDRWIWSLQSSGDFTVASIRKLIDEFTLSELDNLPTRLNSSRRGMDIDYILCPTCGKAVESTRHIFFTCQIARDILHLITSWWNIPYMEVSSYEEWSEIVDEIPLSPRVEEDNIYVAVGKEVKDSRLTLRWALDNLGGWGILYTHQIMAHRAAEMKEVNQILDKYKQICQKAGVFAEGHYVEMNSIENGIVDFILKNNVRKLVMGAAADKQFSKRMVDVRSKKAVYVKLKAAAFCEIQFICKGNVIFTRQGTLDGVDFSTASTSASPNTTSATDIRRVMSDNRGTKIPTFASPSFNSDSTSTSRLTSGRAFDEWSGISRSTNSRFSSCSSELEDDLGQTPYSVSEVSEVQSDYAAVSIFKEEVQNPPPSSVIVFEERGMHDEIYDQLEQAMAEADTYKRDAFGKANGQCFEQIEAPKSCNFYRECADAWTIVYEYLSRGSLEDRLGCKDNTPPLSWQNRIRIAADLKPDNILLDKNLVTKLSDFGISRVLSGQEFSNNNTSICRTGPKGTFLYMDPEFLSTGELTSKSDTYSFGVILLRLLTGKPA
ncbi:RNA-directed DNA polymerase, eukaryota, reverse transcriptase zinc-binding domain protein [Tanacetum coccineum]|uniref:RING-type E3 ubiquitin transferase n=1 Tax=Tanacetum coccineum TaxID=301880 RepID=A0ABQ5GA04_9ASTR